MRWSLSPSGHRLTAKLQGLGFNNTWQGFANSASKPFPPRNPRKQYGYQSGYTTKHKNVNFDDFRPVLRNTRLDWPIWRPS